MQILWLALLHGHVKTILPPPLVMWFDLANELWVSHLQLKALKVSVHNSQCLLFLCQGDWQCSRRGLHCYLDPRVRVNCSKTPSWPVNILYRKCQQEIHLHYFKLMIFGDCALLQNNLALPERHLYILRYKAF